MTCVGCCPLPYALLFCSPLLATRTVKVLDAQVITLCYGQRVVSHFSTSTGGKREESAGMRNHVEWRQAKRGGGVAAQMLQRPRLRCKGALHRSPCVDLNQSIPCCWFKGKEQSVCEESERKERERGGERGSMRKRDM